jgi:hypothetical protein
MHPAQQRRVPRSLYIACNKAFWRAESEELEVVRFLVIRTAKTSGVIPDTGSKVRMVTVTFQMRWRAQSDGTAAWGDPVTGNIAVFRGGYRWFMNRANIRAYSAGACPRS